MILGVMNNGMTLMNIDAFWQQVAQGCLLLSRWVSTSFGSD